MKIVETALPGVVVIEPRVFPDDRGFFLEALRAEQLVGLPDAAGLSMIQLNHSRSVLGTVRGLHFQEPNAQAKLVWVTRGRILDVVVDVRRGSPTFGRHVTAVLDDVEHRRMWIPAGFAHGFSVQSEVADCLYGCTAYYAPASEHTVYWNDPAIGIDWHTTNPIVSQKDATAPRLADAPVLPSYRAAPRGKS